MGEVLGMLAMLAAIAAGRRYTLRRGVQWLALACGLAVLGALLLRAG